MERRPLSKIHEDLVDIYNVPLPLVAAAFPLQDYAYAEYYRARGSAMRLSDMRSNMGMIARDSAMIVSMALTETHARAQAKEQPRDGFSEIRRSFMTRIEAAVKAGGLTMPQP